MISDKVISLNYDDLKETELVYGDLEGIFFLYNPNAKGIRQFSGIESCRELFSRVFNKNRKFVGFACLTEKSTLLKRVNQFFERREEKLGIPPEKRTICYKVADNEQIVILEISDFWKTDSTRRSLFTLFLRTAAAYYSNNFIHALNKYDLASSTKDAIIHFLNGNIYPTYKNLAASYGNGGWYSKFANKPQSFIEKSLVSTPPNS